jgi:hypothetical protein
MQATAGTFSIRNLSMLIRDSHVRDQQKLVKEPMAKLMFIAASPRRRPVSSLELSRQGCNYAMYPERFLSKSACVDSRVNC